MSHFAKLLAVVGVVGGVAPGCSSSSSTAPAAVDTHLAVIEAVTAQMQALYDARPDATPEDLLALLVGRPELTETGSDEDGAWGIFADGRVFALLDDRAGDAEGGTITPLAADDPDTFPVEIPTRDDVRILDTLGTRYKPYWREFEPWFTKQGFVTSAGFGTVEELKNVSGKAVLYIQSHGGRMKTRDGALPVISTGTPVAPAFDLLYGKDLDERRLVYLTVRNDRLPNGQLVVKPVYGITHHFVREYMHIQPDGLVVVDACQSMSPEFVQAFMEAGASLYGGWESSVSNHHSEHTMKFFFDRLLGANEYLPMSPPQRAFNFIDVTGDMGKRGLDVWPSTRGRTAAFRVLPSSLMSLGLLVPSIKHMTLNTRGETPVLVLNGSFGSMPQRVLFNGFPADCPDWYASQVICWIARSGATGVGGVIVETAEPRKSQSNTRTVNEWKGRFTITAKEGCGPGSARSLVATIGADVRFRADADGYRARSGDDVTFEPVQFGVENAPTVFVSATGDCRYSNPLNTWVTRWSGTGETVWDDDHSVGVIDLGKRRIRMHIELDSRDVIQEVVLCDGSPCSHGSYNVHWKTGDEGFEDAVDPWAEAVFDIPLDELLNGSAGTRVGPTPAAWDIPQVTLSWTRITPTVAPDPTAAR